jgi:hypothetical protein
MNSTLAKALVALVPAGILFVGSVLLFLRERTLGCFLQLLGAGCVVMVVLSARFFNYINLCLGNKFRTIHSKRMKNPLCRPGNLSLSAHWDEMDRDQVGDEFCHANSAHLGKRCERQEKQREDGHLIGEFVDFVQREDSIVLPAMGTMLATGTGNADFCGKRSRLRQLGRCFLKSEPVPKQRRPYRRRVKRTAPSTPLRFRAS